MRKPDLAACIANEADISVESAQRALAAILDEITQALSHAESVTLVGFGTFECRRRNARIGRNPQTGADLPIRAVTKIAFRPGKALRAAVFD